jgi:hypothetical protein
VPQEKPAVTEFYDRAMVAFLQAELPITNICIDCGIQRVRVLLMMNAL